MTAPVGAARPARARPGPRPLPAPAPRPRPTLEVVGTAPRHRATTPARRHRRLLPVGAAIAVAVALFGLVAAHAALAQGQFRLQDLERRAAVEQAEYERLRLEVARLEAPSRVVAAAHERLGMVAPSSVTYLTPPAPAPVSRGAAADAGPDGGDRVEAATARWAGVKRELGHR
ncbi:MAG TPA: cell division protein FtsL [Acidimicrobiales bacterium]|nr:cell division protein FtsL [Acidimicrobiales bacterium]